MWCVLDNKCWLDVTSQLLKSTLNRKCVTFETLLPAQQEALQNARGATNTKYIALEKGLQQKITFKDTQGHYICCC